MTESLSALLLSLTTLLSGLTAQLSNLQVPPVTQVAQVASTQKTVLTPADFTYLGYYDIQTNGSNSTYSSGLTHRYVNGQLRLMTLVLGGLHEFTLPASFGSRITSITGSWNISGMGDNFTGIWWDEARQKFWTTSSIDYGSSGAYYPTKIATADLLSNGTVGNLKVISLQGVSSKRVYGGALALPSWFQSQYGCGPYAVGFGGYTSLMDQTSKASLGPSLICIPDPANYANGAEVPSGSFKVLLDTVGNRGYRLWTPGTWPQGSPINYYDGGDTRQNPSSRPTVPPASGAGYLSPNSQGYGWMVWGDSYYNTGMWIETPSKYGYVAIAALCKGFCWYQTSTLAFDARTQELHIWDPNTLGNGVLTRPTSMTELNVPRGSQRIWSGNTPTGNISGATYDPVTGRMYMVGYPFGPDDYTGRIYVYQVNTGGGSPTPVSPTPVTDTTAPTVSITSPTGGTVSGIISISASASDNVSIAGVQFRVNGTNIGSEDTSSPYTVTLDTRTLSNATHTLTAVARDSSGNTATSQSVSISVSNTVVAPTPSQTNPIGHWKLDETVGTVVSDSSGSGNNGTIINGPVWTAGKINNALSFDGLNDYVLIGNPASLIPGSYITMMGWARFDRVDIAQAIVSKYGNDSNITQLRLQGPGEVRCSVGGTTLTTSGAGITSGTWHHLACTYDGSNVRVYVNGVLVGTMAKSGAIADSTGVTWRIGSLEIGSMFMDGLIDDVKIYNRALSATEIANEIGGTTTTPTPTLDTTSPTVSITSPTGGTLSGAVTVGASASDNVGVAGVQFKLDGVNLGAEDTTSPYSVSWDTTTATNSSHTLTAVARDSSGNTATSQSVTVTVSNTVTTPQPTGNGTGIFGEYFDDYKLLSADLKFTRVDPTINFDWGSGSPSTSIMDDSWGVRWTGTVEPRYSQSYTFITNSDDGTRLWVNNQLIIDDWNLHPAQDVFSTPISLVAGQKYNIKLEYHDSSGQASVKLYWQSASQTREIVPVTQLTPSSTTTTTPTTPTPPTSTKFVIGDNIQTTANVNVRSTPSATGALLGTQTTGVTGKVVGGPIYADGFFWWQIDYTSGADGWSVEDFLTKYTAPTTPTTPTTSGGALSLSNFSYQTYHNIKTNGNDSTYSQGLTHRYVNGELRFISLTLQGQIQEYRLPASGQTQTSVTGSWQIPSGSGNNFNGIWFEQAKNRLWVTSAQDYTATNYPAKVSLIQLNADGTATLLKRFYLNVTAKRVYGGCQAVPAGLVTQLGGPYVCGWGGYTSLVMQGGNASIGPTMYAIPDPDTIADGSTVTARTVLDTANSQTYRGVRKTIPVNYFDGGDSRNNPPTRPTVPPVSTAQWLSPNPQGLGWMVWGDSYYNTGFWIGNTFGAIASLCGVPGATTTTVGTTTIQGSGACWYQSSTLAYDGRQFELHTWDGTKLGSNILQRPDHMSELIVPISPTRMASGAMGNTTVNNLAGATYDPVSGKLFVIGFAMHDAYTARIYEFKVNTSGSPTPTSPTDTTSPTVSITSPTGGTLSGAVTVGASASDNVGVAGVQFKLDGVNLGAEDTTSPYSVSWDTTTATNSSHTLTAVARDSSGNTTTSQSVTVTVSNTSTTPTDAIVSDWSAWTDTSDWSACVNGTQTKTQIRTRTVITAATNGGSTPALSETRTITQTCTTQTTSFKIGDMIQTTANVNVRVVGGGTLLGTQPIGSTGKIVAGPTYSNGVTWWQIDYTSGVDGWSGDDYFVLYVASGEPTDAIVSDWSAWTDTSDWSACVNGTQTKTQIRTRTVITAATNGGSTPALSETRTITQTCTTTTTPPPTSTKFVIGDNIQTTANVNVRSTPSATGALLGTQTTAVTGKVVGGPIYADGFFWWQIDYSDGPDGWSVENYLVEVDITTTPTVNKFIIGDGIQTTAKINVRLTPGGRRLGSQNSGVYGIVVGGPTQAQGYTWWKIDYASGVDGWSIENFLIKR